MEIEDVLFGKWSIDGVLEELILSKPVQRLKGIYQAGAGYWVNEKWNVTRYDHSIGTMLLVKKLGGCIQEQIAALLHDVSHTAFSHVIDFALDNRQEDYHENIFEQVIIGSDIPHILERYGYDYRHIVLDHSKWTLLEQPAPELCADRIEYTLRDMYTYGVITKGEVLEFLAKLTVMDGKIAVVHIGAAEWFTETYYKEVIDFFMDPLNAYGYDVLAKALKTALDKGLLQLETLLGTDEEVMELLRNTRDAEVDYYIGLLQRGMQVKADDTDVRKGKVRLIDPSVVVDGELKKASFLSMKVKQSTEEAKKKAERGMEIISPFTSQ
ncbi:MAG: HD domain-containing protein [Lysinibacillus sp.]